MITLRLTLLMVLLDLSSAIYAQQVHSDLIKSGCSDCNHLWVIKFAPLSLFDPDNTIQFAAERLLTRGQTIQTELGYGWQGIGLWETTVHDRYSNKETWRVRVEWRLYFHPADKPRGVYLAAEGLYKQVNVRETSSNGVPCTGPCVPGVLSRTPTLKHVWGGHLKMGYQLPLLSDNRLLLDMYWGLGARYIDVERPDLPIGIIPNESNGLFGQWPGFPFMPKTTLSLSLGVKLGHTF